MKIISDFVTNSSECDFYNECDCDCHDCNDDCDCDCDFDCEDDCAEDCDDYDCDDYDCSDCSECRHYEGQDDYWNYDEYWDNVCQDD